MPKPKDQGHFICDVDGVLLDIVKPACKILNADFNLHLTPASIITWDWEYVLSFPSDYWDTFWQQLWSVEADPYPGANDFLAALKGLGFTPVGLTTRPMNWKGIEPPSLARTSAERDNGKLDLAYTVYVDNHSDKISRVKMLWPDARFAIEDNPKNARDLGSVRHVVRSMLLDRPWNRGCIDALGTWGRVYGYSDIIKQVMDGGLLK